MIKAQYKSTVAYEMVKNTSIDQIIGDLFERLDNNIKDSIEREKE